MASAFLISFSYVLYIVRYEYIVIYIYIYIFVLIVYFGDLFHFLVLTQSSTMLVILFFDFTQIFARSLPFIVLFWISRT